MEKNATKCGIPINAPFNHFNRHKEYRNLLCLHYKIFLQKKDFLSFAVKMPEDESVRARMRRRDFRPRKSTKGGFNGKRRPRDTETMVVEQWTATENLSLHAIESI
jgi:hypothetical protein